MKHKYKIKNTKPLVSILCQTYNHENYVRSALDGFLKQKTNFTFEILIHDDASTDQTANIIREYEKMYHNVIKPIYQEENQYSKGVGIATELQFPRARGKYIAICEGDDYWTDPLKLQKQVNFLEENAEYGLVYTDVDRLIDKTNIIEKSAFKNQLGVKKNTFEDFLINAWWLATCTWMIRTDVYQKFKCLQNNSYVAGDLAILLIMSKNSKIKFLRESTAVYRILTNSASHFKGLQTRYNFFQGIFKIQMDFALYYNVNQIIINKIRCGYYLRIYQMACTINDKKVKVEAFDYLKKRNLLNNKNKLRYYLTKFSVVRRILAYFILKDKK